jgi:hypothetical protein
LKNLTEDVQVNVIENPVSVDPEEVPLRFQLEVIEFQCSAVCRNKHRESSLRDFYKSLDSEKYKKSYQNCTENIQNFWKRLHM